MILLCRSLARPISLPCRMAVVQFLPASILYARIIVAIFFAGLLRLHIALRRRCSDHDRCTTRPLGLVVVRSIFICQSPPAEPLAPYALYYSREIIKSQVQIFMLSQLFLNVNYQIQILLAKWHDENPQLMGTFVIFIFLKTIENQHSNTSSPERNLL